MSPARPWYTYKITVLPRPNEDDGRPSPSDETVRNFLFRFMEDVLPDGEAPIELIKYLMNGGFWTVRMQAQEIAAFHHLRRRYGACPRVKWEMENLKECGCEHK